MIFTVSLERRMASATAVRSLRRRVISPASTAMPEPLAMAMAASDWARAGASLMPSPTMATLRPLS